MTIKKWNNSLFIDWRWWSLSRYQHCK